MAARTNIALSDLPLFTGHPRFDEEPFTPKLDIQTFIHAIEGHCQERNITSSGKKLNILFNHIHQTKGDALRLESHYAGLDVNFDQVKTDLLFMYGEFSPITRRSSRLIKMKERAQKWETLKQQLPIDVRKNCHPLETDGDSCPQCSRTFSLLNLTFNLRTHILTVYCETCKTNFVCYQDDFLEEALDNPVYHRDVLDYALDQAVTQ